MRRWREYLQEGGRLGAQAAGAGPDQPSGATADDCAADRPGPQADAGGAPGLAWKALNEAMEWQRADAPEAPVRLAQGLVGLRLGRAAESQALLQEGVHLAGGGVVGWFRAALEAALMGVADGADDICGRELDRAQRTPPGRDATLAIIGLLGQTSLGQSETGVSGRVLAPLVARLDPWLRAGACRLGRRRSSSRSPSSSSVSVCSRRCMPTRAKRSCARRRMMRPVSSRLWQRRREIGAA